MTKAQTRIADLIVRVQREFLGRRTPLTAREIRRRLFIDEGTCNALLDLDALVDAGVLTRLEDLYMPAGDAGPSRPPGTPRRVTA